MNNLCTEAGFSSLNKAGEQLCGDRVEYRVDENGALLTLADGLGSGVKASILSTLTAKILTTMVSGGMSIDSCVETMVKTLPVCKVRDIAYSTFTIVQITDNRHARLIQFDNPRVVLLRNGKNCEYPISVREISGKQIMESSFPVEEGDLLVAMSDGAIYAGVGHEFNYGWRRENIIQFLEGNHSPEHSAQYYAGIVADECGKLYEGEPGDDTTVAAVRIRSRHPVNLMIGPPASRDQDEKMMNLFFAREGTRIVCGGTTAEIAARHLGKPLIPSEHYSDPNIPPTSRLEGVDPGDRGRRDPVPGGAAGRKPPERRGHGGVLGQGAGRRLPHRAGTSGAGHRHPPFRGAGGQSRAPGPGPAGLAGHQDPAGRAAGGEPSKNGQAGDGELLLATREKTRQRAPPFGNPQGD